MKLIKPMTVGADTKLLTQNAAYNTSEREVLHVPETLQCMLLPPCCCHIWFPFWLPGEYIEPVADQPVAWASQFPAGPRGRYSSPLTMLVTRVGHAQAPQAGL